MLEVALVLGKSDHVTTTLLILTFGQVKSIGGNMKYKSATS
jgi:hypothetical protein